jgi:hypothetical protein
MEIFAHSGKNDLIDLNDASKNEPTSYIYIRAPGPKSNYELQLLPLRLWMSNISKSKELNASAPFESG